MKLDYRNDTIVQTIARSSRNWNKLFVQRRDFMQIDADTYSIAGCALSGGDTLLCGGDDKTPDEVAFDYFPLSLKFVDPRHLTEDEWFTFAVLGDLHDRSGKLQWLFDAPALKPLEDDLDIWRGDSSELLFHLCFYGGLQIINANGQSSMTVQVSQEADYLMRMHLAGC